MTDESKKRPTFRMEITYTDDGRIQTQTTREGLPYELVVSALSQQLYIYNKLWAEESSTAFKK